MFLAADAANYITGQVIVGDGGMTVPDCALNLRRAATVIHTGSRTATSEGRVVDHAGRLYAHGTATCRLVEERAAKP